MIGGDRMEDHSVLGYLRRLSTDSLEIALEDYLREPEQYIDSIEDILQVLEERRKDEQKND